MSHLDEAQLEALAKSGESHAHLASCSDCTAQVQSARGRQRLFAGLKPYTLSDMAFRRVEARLMEEADAGFSRSPWWAWALGVGLVAAATTFLLVPKTQVVERPVTVPVARITTPPFVMPQGAFEDVTVLRASRDARLRDGANWRSVAAGDVLKAKSVLSGARVVLACDSTTAWAFVASGEFSLGGEVTATLGAGQLVARVGPEPVVLQAGTRRFVASDASFAINRVAAEVVLDVVAGEVDAWDSATQTRAHFAAPVKVRWADGTAAGAGSTSATATVEAIEVPARPWAKLDLSAVPVTVALELDGLTVVRSPWSVLLGQGRHRVQVTLPGQPVKVQWVDLIGGKPTTLTWPPPAAVERDVDPDALARVVEDLKRQRPKLAACYEKWLKANPMAQGQVDLVLSVSAKGVVRAAKLKGEPISPESAQCLLRTAKTLVLPPLGSDEELEVPLMLTSHR